MSGVTITANYHACVFRGGHKQEVVQYTYITPAGVKARSRQKRGAANAGRGNLPDGVYDRIFLWYMLYPHFQQFIYLFSNLVF